MFQLLRRVSGAFLPRPDRPWRDDATSHAPAIGRKRRRSITEQDCDRSSPSAPKRTKNEPVEPDTECDAASRVESPKGDAVPPVEGQDVKEATKGVKEVELEDRDKLEGASISPEAVPLPDSASGTPEPESESQEAEREPESATSDEDEKTKDQEHIDDRDSVASSSPGDYAADGAETEPITTNTDTAVDEIVPAQEVKTTVVESVLIDIPEILEVKA